MRSISVVEGEPFEVRSDQAERIRRAVERLQARVKPRLPFLTFGEGQAVLSNFVGVLRLDNGTLVNVAPKVEADEQWVHAVLDLLLPEHRVDVAGMRRAGLSTYRPDLMDAFAAVYAARLDDALRKEGPLLILEREERTLPFLKGKLHASEYLRHAAWKPHQFPSSYDKLTADNDFTAAMTDAARVLARLTSSLRLRRELLRLAEDVRPGAPDFVPFNPAVLHRPLPQQWAVYEPAWAVVVAVMSRAALLGRAGEHLGLEAAIETWPLLETLLLRSLNAAARSPLGITRRLRPVIPGQYPLLERPTPPGKARSVVPDGLMKEAGEIAATFEAKYAPGPRGQNWPKRDHVFQALSTAAALSSPLSVLIYPTKFAPIWWDVHGFSGYPSHLAAVGLDMFSYRKGEGDQDRGELILRILNSRPSVSYALGQAAERSEPYGPE